MFESFLQSLRRTVFFRIIHQIRVMAVDGEMQGGGTESRVTGSRFRIAVFCRGFVGFLRCVGVSRVSDWDRGVVIVVPQGCGVAVGSGVGVAVGRAGVRMRDAGVGRRTFGRVVVDTCIAPRCGGFNFTS